MEQENKENMKEKEFKASGKASLFQGAIGIILVLVLILGVSITAVDVAKKLWDNRKDEMEDVSIESILDASYSLYLGIEEKRQASYELSPIDIYLPKLVQIREEYKKEQEKLESEKKENSTDKENNQGQGNTETDNSDVENMNGDNSSGDSSDTDVSDTEEESLIHVDTPLEENSKEEKVTEEEYYNDPVEEYPDEYYYGNENVSEYDFHTKEIESFDEQFYHWRNNLGYSNAVSYAIIDRLDQRYGDIKGDEKYLSYLLEGIKTPEMDKKLKEKYAGYFVLEFDDKGKVSLTNSYGVDVEKLESMISKTRLENEYNYLYRDKVYLEIKPGDVAFVEPTNVAMVFTVDKNYQNVLNHYYDPFIDYNSALFEGLVILFSVAIGIVVLAAIVLFCIRPLGIGNGFTSKIPLEVTSAFVVALVFATFGLAYISSNYPSGAIEDYLMEISFSPSYAKLFTNLAMYGGWILYLTGVYLTTLAILQLFRKGLKRYLLENVLIIRFFSSINRSIGRVVKAILRVKSDDPVHKTVLKYVTFNFILILIMCSIWFFGIPVLLLYSVILYYFMKKYLADLKEKHDYILHVTHQMAQGNLDVPIEKDLGVLQQIGDELSKIQYGFKRAVDEEVKSQNMRTELITNVSHDLKTPLTAIITYVNLLKEENLTKEQQMEYIDTLDRKSLRLKQLIEDLFEVSKINSNNITLNPVEVDIVELVKQVELELSDRFEEAGIEVRSQIPEEKVILTLDSQKTYRIFENLFVNVIKYAMSGTRAYVTLRAEDTLVSITIKNISATELNLSAEEISERFVRGDKSRNTEGSGLGLAIVKSLVEIQGGTFQILMDGDLFKVVIQFIRS